MKQDSKIAYDSRTGEWSSTSFRTRTRSFAKPLNVHYFSSSNSFNFKYFDLVILLYPPPKKKQTKKQNKQPSNKQSE